MLFPLFGPGYTFLVLSLQARLISDSNGDSSKTGFTSTCRVETRKRLPT
jgi:hypothetical protein